jgi:hypothetical protein
VLGDDSDGIRPAMERLFSFLPMRIPIPVTEQEMLESLAAASMAIPADVDADDRFWSGTAAALTTAQAAIRSGDRSSVAPERRRP